MFHDVFKRHPVLHVCAWGCSAMSRRVLADVKARRLK